MAIAQTHTETSQTLIRQAEEELRNGDIIQASEKGWGATAHALKAVADIRGWRHDRHYHLVRIAETLAEETSDLEVRRLFDGAAALHANFYEMWLREDGVASRLEGVKTLLALLEPLHRNGQTES